MARILEGRNRANPSEAGSFVDKFEALESEVLREKMAYMERCRRIRGQQKDLLDDAKSQGVNGSLIKAIVKARAYEAKAAAIEDNLEDDDRKFFQDIREALGDYGDLPLGQAAIAKEESLTDAVVDAVKNDLTDAEQEAWDRAAPAGSA